MDAQRLRRALWRSRWSPLEPVVEEAAHSGKGATPPIAVYAVGGSVRDLLLDRTPRDLDLVVVGDGLAFAERMGIALGIPVTLSRRFLTAELRAPGGERIDVSTARRERYPGPGRLPEVTPAGIEEDLARRDFTVNTFALGVAGEVGDRVLADPRAGGDLRDGRLRVLHGASFEDDPTRILRGIALELRLDFRLDGEAERLAAAAAASGVFAVVSGQRIWQELERLLSAEPAGALARLEELGVLEAIAPALRFDEAVRRRLEGALAILDALPAAAAAGDRSEPAGAALLALAWDLDEPGRRGLASRLALPNGYRRPLLGAAPEAAAWLASGRDEPASEIHERLAPLSRAELALVGWSGGADAPATVRRELEEWRPLELSIGAGDLLDHGLSRGPAIGRILASTRRARLDGRIAADEELDYALAMAAKEPEAGSEDGGG